MVDLSDWDIKALQAATQFTIMNMCVSVNRLLCCEQFSILANNTTGYFTSTLQLGYSESRRDLRPLFEKTRHKECKVLPKETKWVPSLGIEPQAIKPRVRSPNIQDWIHSYTTINHV